VLELVFAELLANGLEVFEVLELCCRFRRELWPWI
jgi:hypothetical protein